MTLRPLHCVLVLALPLAGCSDRREGPRVPEGGSDLGAPEVPWKQKNRDERMAYMAAHVYPAMKKLFQEYDSQGYATFGCETCHGADMEARDYAMPNDLYELPADAPIAEAMDYDEDVAAFMMGKVAPAMKRLLGTTGSQAQSCFSCHPKSE